MEGSGNDVEFFANISFQVGECPAELDQIIVPELEEGKEYEFRVIPVNDAGEGTPSDPSDSVLTKCRRCEFSFSVIFNILGAEFSCITTDWRVDGNVFHEKELDCGTE